MESLIPIISRLQDVFAAVEQNEIKLPQIVVIGAQSTGKSSLLEGIVGRDFLPRGEGCVTRCPLLLHLHHEPCINQKQTSISKINELTTEVSSLSLSSTTANTSISKPLRPSNSKQKVNSHSPNTNGQQHSKLSPSISSNNIDQKKVKTNEYVIFKHKPDEKFYDFKEVKEEILKHTHIIAGDSNTISKDPIILDVYSPKVINLSLVDLPGFVKFNVDDQPEDIEDQIIKIVTTYIKNENSIILAVAQATDDLVIAESIKFAKSVDKDKNRTVCVVTKLDKEDNKKKIEKMLMGEKVKFERGIIGVVNRSQQDIDANKSVDEGIKFEAEYLKTHYSDFADVCGIPYLKTKLHQMLTEHIRICLPELNETIDKQIQLQTDKIKECGEEVKDKKATLSDAIVRFSNLYISTLNGNPRDLVTDNLIGGARIAAIFENDFSIGIMAVDPLHDLTLEQSLIGVRNASGPRPPNAQIGFELLASQKIKLLLAPCLKCVTDVSRELNKMVDHCLHSMPQFPELNKFIHRRVKEFITLREAPTQDAIKNLIEMHCAYINTKHPDFKQDPTSIKNSSTASSLNEDENGIQNHALPTAKNSSVTEANTVDSQSTNLTASQTNEIKAIMKMTTEYFEIVRTSVQDMVPKAITKDFINHIQRDLQKDLMKISDDEDKFDALLAENRNIKIMRNSATRKLQELEKAREIISELQGMD